MRLLGELIVETDAALRDHKAGNHAAVESSLREIHDALRKVYAHLGGKHLR